MANFWGFFSKAICRLSCVLFIALFALRVSGAYADECQLISGGGGSTNYVNDNMYCTDWEVYGIQYQGSTQVAYYDCDECENGVTPVQTEVDDGWSGICGRTITAGSCHECDYDSQCGTDGWVYTAPGTEKYIDYSCAGHYCHSEYTNMRCDTGYEPDGNSCKAAPTCTSSYSCSGTNWVNDHDLVDCNNYSTFCFDIVEGQGTTPQQLFTCSSCKSGYTLVTRYYDPDISGCDTYSYGDCECQKTDSAWSYNSSGHYYSRTVVNQYTCTESTEYECAAGYYGTGGSCTACNVSFSDSCSVTNGTGTRTCYHTSSSRGSTSSSDCTGTSNCGSCCATSCDPGYTVENCACVSDCGTTNCPSGYRDGPSTYNSCNTTAGDACYKNCSKTCSGNDTSSCPSHATCTYNTSYKTYGEQYYGGSCNASSSLCPVSGVSCNSGYYLTNNDECDDCPSGCTCAGGTAQPVCAVSCDANEYLDGGTCYDCPNSYPYSNGGTHGIDYCYRDCETGDVAHSTSVSGIYYQDDYDTCEAESCGSGYYLSNGACPSCSSVSNTESEVCTASSCSVSNGTCSCETNSGTRTCTGHYTGGTGGSGDADDQCTGCSSWGSCSGCTKTNVSCNSGYYLTNNDECDDCPSGCTCAGGTAQPVCAVSCDANEYYDNGTCYDCPNEYPYSDGGTHGIDYCYRDCETSDVAHSTSVTGIYYQDNINTCEAESCVNGYHVSGDNCVPDTSCSAGQYPNGNTCGNCTNKPANSTYTGVGTTSTNCPWECDSGYTQSGNSCVEDGPTCSAGQYPNGNTCGNCTNKPANSTYTGVGTTATNCPWECDSGYVQSGNSCVLGSSCTGAKYWDSSQSRCVACPEGYDYNTSNGKTSINQCQIHCDAGTTVWWPNNGYSRVTAICPGTQDTRISTGLIPGSNNISGTLSVIPTAAQGGALMTMGSNTYLYANGSGGYTLYYPGNNSISRSGAQSLNTIHNIEYAISPVATLTVGGSTTTGNAVVGTPAGAFTLFDGTNYGMSGPICINHATLTVDGMRVLDLTPVMNNNTGDVALYDSVGGLLYGDNTGGSLYSYGNELSNTNYQCIDPGIGKYAAAATINYGSFGTRGNCTNAPEHATYISSGTSANSCEWECDSGYAGSSANGDTECAEDESTFSITTTSGASTLQFSLQATGTFTVDCGTDGRLTRVSGNGAYCGLSGNTITISRVTLTCVYQCAWSPSAGVHTITFGGTATDYAPNTTGAESCTYPTFRINNNYAQYVASVTGNMSRVFPYKTGNAIYNARQPRFCHAFQNCTNLTTISDGLFRDYTKAANNAFHDIFNGCSSLTAIPPHLFSNITEVSGYAFCGAFMGCSSVQSIPSTLWEDLTTISGSTAAQRAGVFQGTFRDMTSVTTMPEDLFAGVSAANTDQFCQTFDGCTNMGSYIPPSTFGGLVAAGSPQDNTMWYHTFYNTQLLTACPAGTIQFITQYEGDNDTINWGGKVSCEPCPTGYIPNNNQSSCVAGTSTVTLNKNTSSNDNTTVATVTATYDAAMPLKNTSNANLTVPTRTGYTFTGYYDARTDGTQYYTAALASARNWDKTGAQTLYAQWTAQTSTVTLNANGGTDGATPSVTATYDSAMPGIPAVNLPTRTGYTFEGFYDTNAATGGTQYYTSSGASARTWNKTGNQILYARWTANISGAITLNSNRWASNDAESAAGTATTAAAPTTVYSKYNTGIYSNSGATTSITKLTTNPVMTGYTFGGFYTTKATDGVQVVDASGNFTTASKTQIATTGDVATWYARWTAQTSTVTLNKNTSSSDTTTVATVTATYDAAMPTKDTSNANLTVPTRTGYTFAGYYDARTNGTQYYTAALASVKNWDKTGAQTLYAHWTANTLTINLNKSSGTGTCGGATGTNAGSMTCTYDSACTTPNWNSSTCNITNGSGTSQKVLTGWSTAENGGGTVYGLNASIQNIISSGSTTLYAVWADPVCTITNGNATHTVASNTPTCAVTCTNGYSQTGYADTTTTFNVAGTANNATVTASCLPRTYHVVLDPKRYTDASDETGTAATSAGTTEYWYVYKKGPGTGHACYYYKVAVTSANEGDSANCIAGTNGVSITAPTLTGYTFGGYYNTKPGSGTQYVNASGGTTGNLYSNVAADSTLYAKWTANCNAVTFNPNNGTAGSVTTLYKKSGVTTWYKNSTCSTAYTTDANLVPTRDGYKLRGFYTTALADISASSSSPSVRYFQDTGATTTTGTNWLIYEPKTLYAAWAINCTTPANGTCSVTVSGATTTYAASCDTGYTVSGATTSTPVCNANTYTITLDDSTNGGSGGSGTAKEVYNTKWTNSGGTTITSVTIPTKGSGASSAVFMGYYDAASGGNQKIPATGVLPGTTTFTADTTLKAQFATCTCTKGTNVASCTATGVSGNKCTYSYTCNDGYHVGSSGTTATGTFTATNAATASNTSPNCSGNTITLTWANGGHGTAPTTPASCTYGGTFTTAAAITGVTGYTFNNWSVNSKTFSASASSTACNYTNLGVYSGTATITATWTATTSTVTLNKNTSSSDTTTVATVTATYDAAMPTKDTSNANLTVPTRTGYTFNGYYDARTNGTQYYTAALASAKTWDKTGAQTLYAQWTAKTCTVTFKTGNKTMGTQNFTYGTAQNLTAVSSLSNVPVSSTYGWSFEGWATSVNTSTKTYANSASVNNFCADGDVTLYGIWKRTVPFKYYNGASATSTTTSNRTQYYYNTSTTAAAAGAVSTYALATQSTYNWAPVGWVLNNTTSTTTASTATTTPGNVTPAITAGGSNAGPTYYALYNRTATVAYNANGGSGTTASTTGTQYFNAGGSSAIALNLTLASNSFTKTGHTFTNWTAGSTTGVPYLAGATYTFPNTTWSSTDTYTMYARWEANTYDITYYMNGGTPAYTQVEYLTSSTAKQYVDTGVTFEVGKDIRVVTSFSNPSTSYRKVLTGNYKNDTVSVFALELGGSGQSKPGYFRNYTSTGGSTLDVWSSAALPANTLISVDASYDAASRKTSNVLKYGTTTLAYQVNATSAASDAATRSLRLFYDYRTGSEIAYAVSIGATRIYKDGTLAANLIPARRNSDNVLGMYNTLTGEFNASSGTFTAGADVGPLPSKYTYGIGATIAVGTPTRDHSTFAGWCTNSGLTSCATTQTIATTATGAKTYYAKWTCDTGYAANNDGTACVAQTSTVTLNKNTSSSDTTTVATVTATYDAAMPTKDTSNANLTAPTRTGYTFAGYYDARTGGTQYYTAALASAKTWDKTGAQTLYAHWTATTSTVTLNKNTSSSDTTTVTTVTATYDAAMPLKNTSNANLVAPTRSKANNTTYAFNGYYDARTGGTQYYTAALASAKNWDKTGAQTLYAQWTMTCDAGYYLPASSLACSECTDGKYCPGGTAFTYSTSAQGINSCTTNAGSQYTHSGTGSANAVARDAVTDCYVTTTAGKYVATANANTQTNCTAGDYCPSTDIFYGATGGRLNCNTGTTTGIGTTSPWTSAASATARTSCYRNISLNKNGMSGTLTLPTSSGCKSLTSASGTSAQTLQVYYDVQCNLPTTALSNTATGTTYTGTKTWATSANAASGFVNNIKTTSTDASMTYYAGKTYKCSDGYYLKASTNGACSACEDAYYCPAMSSAVYYSTSAQGRNACSALSTPSGWIANGTYSSASPRSASSDCRYTAPNMSSTPTNCATVSSNTVSYSGSAWNTDFYTVTANSGAYVSANNSASPACTQCTGATFSAGGAATSCTDCPTGYTANTDAGKSANTQCQISVTGGHYIGTAGQNSSNWGTCAKGTAKAAHTVNYNSTSSCDNCADGTFAGSTGMASCTACVTGSYSEAASGSTKCVACPAGRTTSGSGTHYNATANTACGTTCDAIMNRSTWATPSWNTNNTMTNLCTVGICVAGSYKSNNTCPTCADNKWSNAGASSCTSCTTAKGYGNTGTDAANHAGKASCTVTCPGGQYVATAGAGCVNVGAGNWCAGGTVAETATLARTACATGLTTIGYGTGADGVGDCGHKFHVGNDVIYLRSAKRTNPSLSVKVGGTTFYGNMSIATKNMSDNVNKKLKVNNNGTVYHVYDDSADTLPEIPSDYTPVDYISTNHDAYFMTTLNVNDFDRVTAQVKVYDFKTETGKTDYPTLFGSTTGSSNGAQNAKTFRFYNNSNYATCSYGSAWASSWATPANTTNTKFPLNAITDVDIKLAAGEQYIKFNGVTKASGTTSYTLNNSYPVSVFAMSYAGNKRYIPHLDCNRMTFYLGNTVVHDLIPVRRNSDSKCGMYDPVTGTFFSSAVSAQFTCPAAE